MAAYVLQCVYSNYEKVVRREEEAISGFSGKFIQFFKNF